jgi:hypothetical protein
MRKSCSFHDFDDLDWPSPDELKKYFSAGGAQRYAEKARPRISLRSSGLRLLRYHKVLK